MSERPTPAIVNRPGRVRSVGMTYVVAITALLAAVLLRLLLDPLMGDALPLVTLFGAVAAAAWVGGYRPAAMVAILGYVACAYLFIPPRGRLGIDNLGIVVGLVAYLFTCALIIAFGEVTRISPAARESAARVVTGDAAQYWRRGHHHRHRLPHFVPECRGRVLDRVDATRCRRATTRQGVSHHQRRNSSAGRKPGHKGASGGLHRCPWRITRC